MRSLRTKALFAALAIACLLPVSATRAADASDYAGKWTVKVDNGFGTEILWLVELSAKEGKLAATVADSTPEFKGSKIKSATLTDKGPSLVFEVPERPEFKVTAVEAKAKDSSIPALLEVRGNPFFARLDKFDKDKLPEQLNERTEHFEELNKIFMTEGDEKKAELLEKFLKEKEVSAGLRNLLTMRVLQVLAEKGENKDALSALSGSLLDAVSKYGPAIEMKTRLQLAGVLADGDKELAPLALKHLEAGEKLLSKDADYDDQSRVLTLRKTIYEKTGNKDAVAKIDAELDELFEKNNIPFEVKKYDGKAERTVVVELFTGAECPPCVAADVSFDAMLKRYSPENVILLQYHMHIPGPDPLTNDASSKRGQNYYGLRGTPTVYINGTPAPPAGGFRQHAEGTFERLTSAVEGALETKAGATLKLAATRKDDKISIKADVAGLAKTGEKVRLRLVLIEDVVKYTGGNRQRLHHHVVRDMPGGPDGFALTEKTFSKTVDVDLAALKKSLTSYLDEYEKLRRFPNSDRPMELANLKVVALVQDDATKEILAAEQVDAK